MRGFKLLGGVVATVVAIAILPAGAASAAKVLKLSSSGTPVVAGTPGSTGLSIAECIVFSKGSVAVNNAATDKITAVENLFSSCAEHYAISGTITEMLLGATGKLTLKGTITLTIPGPCVYEFKKFKTKFTVPGEVLAFGSTSGKLNKKISEPTCAKKVTEEFITDGTGENNEVPLEASN